MSSKIFLQSLQSKLKGGNARSIHLNALPGRFATRLDLKQLDIVEKDLSAAFLNTLLNKPSFEFKISFDKIDLNEVSQENQKKLDILAKRLNSIIIENEDYFKEHGTKTLGFGYPILIKRSVKDPAKIIKAPLFIWPLDAMKSKNKVNEWSLFRNKKLQPNGKLVDEDLHSVSINEVLLSFIKGEDNITLPNFGSEALEDALIDKTELLDACAEVLNALNAGLKADNLDSLQKKFETAVNVLPEKEQIDSIANNNAYIHFGGVFGLFRVQKESIITDISKLLERFEEFEFDELTVENLTTTTFSAINTDPSQQAIISKLGVATNQIIQGPPGTGKSQSLTALITNALANGLKCLVVCEKKTALDIIKRNIDTTYGAMGELVAVIDDVNKDREMIVDSVRNRQNGPGILLSHQQAHTQYDSLKNALQHSVVSLNRQHSALDQPVYASKKWGQIVGRYLKLKKKYPIVPLMDVLATSQFSFKDEKELETLLAVLKKGYVLFSQCRQVSAVFAPLNNTLFTGQTVGEARVKITDFIANALTQIPLLEKDIQGLLTSGAEWTRQDYSCMPDAIQQVLQPYVSFYKGTDLTEKILPASFELEGKLQDAALKLQELQTNAKGLQQQYRHQLEQHYGNYHGALTTSISVYLSFVKDNLDMYGGSFMRNDSGARFKTNFLSLFSQKHKQIKQNRIALRNRIEQIRQIQLQKNYIQHTYNDHMVAEDLGLYVRNIETLQQKVADWQQAYPGEINAFVDKMNAYNFHPDFGELKQGVQQLMLQVKASADRLATDYKLIPATEFPDINAIIDTVPAIISAINNWQQLVKMFREQYLNRSGAYNEIRYRFENIENNKGAGKVCDPLFINYKSLPDALNSCKVIKDTVAVFNQHIAEFRTFHEWKTFFLDSNKQHQELIDIMIGNLDGAWDEAFECWYLFWVLTLHEPPYLPKSDYELTQYKQLKEDFNKAQLKSIIASWAERQERSVQTFRTRGGVVNSLFNKKGAKGMRRNSLRAIIRDEFKLFTDFFPALLLNPSVCSSVLPLEEGIFDLVIFDEASQLRLEDTYAALIRGKAKIVSGDKHQMAPSSYFEGGAALLDPIDEADSEIEEDEEAANRNNLNVTQLNLADSESLLAYATDKSFTESYLDIHYRSRHPYLIDFSNHAFYGKRLIPVPAMQDYTPIEYRQIDGIYDEQVNKAEALSVVALLRQEIKPKPDGTWPSVGVATFNIYQRNLILEEISIARQADDQFNSFMSQLGNSFFVKNLENIQGDERDVIIISTTFGRKKDGSFTQNFGPIIQGKGHRMLNVIITRAKDKVYLCTSFPQEFTKTYRPLIQQKGNKGRGILYAYLNYAKAVSDGNNELRMEILNMLSQYCIDRLSHNTESEPGSESPFEEEVYERLVQHLGADRIEQQYQVGGFRIDMVIRHKHSNKPLIALECDGAKYHSSTEAYAWDAFRQEQLEQYGFVFYRIWSTKWWDAAEKELEELLGFIYKWDAGEAKKDVVELRIA